MSSGTTRHTRRFTAGSSARAVVGLQHQLHSRVVRGELVRAGPTGAFLKPSSPTFSMYFLGTIHPAPVAGVP